jgi:hypothetical protein
MHTISASRPTTARGPVLYSAVIGTTLVVIGLATAYVALATPIATRLAPTVSGSSSGSTLAIWSFALIAGGAFLVAGTSRLAATVAIVRNGLARKAPVARVVGELSEDVVLATNVTPPDGRAIPELVIGPFGAVIFTELLAADRLRRVGAAWETRGKDGWQPIEDPLAAAGRDAERVRRWMTTSDLDFVVRVYAAVVTDDPAVVRTAGCAVVPAERIPAWLESLPRQRSLTEARRNRMLRMVRRAAGGDAQDGW